MTANSNMAKAVIHIQVRGLRKYSSYEVLESKESNRTVKVQ